MKFEKKLKIVLKKNCEPAYNEKYIKAKIKPYSRNFHNNKIPKEGSQCVCFSVILISCVFRAGNNY